MHIVEREEEECRDRDMWIFVALVVDFFLFLLAGPEIALDFLGGYLIELSLSIDNLFVFLSIFSSFAVPEEFRHRVLKYGIFGAAVLRMIVIVCGAALIARMEWILYGFGILLFVNGIKLILSSDEQKEVGDSMWLRLIRRLVPITEDYCGDCFFVKRKRCEKGGRKYRYATPLFLVLVVIELSDIVFAIDSIPAVFSVTTNPVIVYSSNLLAVFGLRQLYFILEKLAARFAYVKYGIAAVLMFTGAKLLISFFGKSISTIFSICFIAGTLFSSIVVSVWMTKK
ncbi:MAG: TerC/Alx family metal homeostasis membrane protein [Lachnospiraceae bacterium]|nr:TerC/Alx family metal homeostasis membrane protein [Lachnospiraceae bacterium]